ncbi:dipeptidase PepE [Goodfellowiella coeruleoviolacea]|uniref:dipeptidase E n=1 Tax=Goodfellowiella coeruleoviolacea TaxID=334858 RepID=A0AAE3GA07_9PSEU|nr:dipeptidase PepE [Goodfellowiella coeruleoviolacea]MCP2163620.1 dipeptidase E [Goodfellowiella coeruleoviolacea]
MRLLLLSNSTAPGRGYLEHATDVLRDTLSGVRRLVFVPFALADHDDYTRKVAEALAPLGVEVLGAHQGDPLALLDSAQAVFVGGGNTFRLLKRLHATGLVTAINAAVRAGTVYIGSSAGTNVACPTVRTTNDMPIVQPPSLDAVGLVPFQINPHYLDPLPDSTHMGETREERLVQFLEENDGPVLGMREGTWLVRAEDTLTLGGTAAGARLFRRGQEPAEIATGTDLSWLLDTRTRYDAGA